MKILKIIEGLCAPALAAESAIIFSEQPTSIFPSEIVQRGFSLLRVRWILSINFEGSGNKKHPSIMF